MMKISGIYKIQSKIKPNRIYIGSAINIDKRWVIHLFRLKNNGHHSKKLQNHYNKYGKDDLQFSILLGCEKEKLIQNEQYFLDSYNPWFNNSMIAGSTLGTKRSDKFKKKISERSKGNKYSLGIKRSEEFIKNLSRIHKGKKRRLGAVLTEETKKKIRNSLLGHKRTEESKRKQSMSLKEKHYSSWNKGIPMSEEIKEKVRKKLIGRKPWNKGIKTNAV